MFAEDDLTIQSVVTAEGWNWPNGRPRLCSVLLTHGRGIYSDPQAARPVDSGDVLVFSTRFKGGIRPLPRGKIRFSYFFAQLEHLTTVFTLPEFCLLEKSVRSLANPWYYPAQGRAARKCHELLGSVPKALDLEHRCHTLQLLGAILSEEFKLSRLRYEEDDLPHPGGTELLNRISLEEIQHSSIKDLADKYSYSRRHLNRIFHERFGISVSALKMEVRLLKALSLLRDPSVKLKTVAVNCGFNYLSLFSARFKKRFGTSPRQWRQQSFTSTGNNGLKANGSKCLLQNQGLCPLSKENGKRETTEQVSRGAECFSQKIIQNHQRYVDDQIVSRAGY